MNGFFGEPKSLIVGGTDGNSGERGGGGGGSSSALEQVPLNLVCMH